MAEAVDIGGSRVLLADPVIVPERTFVGRKDELQLCRVAWGINSDGTGFLGPGTPPLSFRLEGPPGLGKNELVYEITRRLEQPLYIVQGHEELTPEDLALLLTPDPQPDYDDSVGLTLRASPLATALYTGGLFLFDEINRVPERALSPLASVLDGRQYVYSAMTGMNIGPRDENASANFRFCCALNPALSADGRVIPEYIEQRTLPVVEILPPPFEDLHRIIEGHLNPSPEFLDGFNIWYAQQERIDISVRQALTLMNYAMNYAAEVGGDPRSTLERLAPRIFGRKS